VSKIKIESYKKMHSVSLLSEENPTLTPSDVINASCRSFAGKIFSEPIKQSDPTLSTAEYTNYCRFFLGLPPVVTIGGASPRDAFDYPVQRCLATHNGVSPFLDANANHASSGCPAATHPRNVKHRKIATVIVSAAREAGLSARTEPDTHSLLLGEFSKADCRRVFPKAASKAYKIGFENVSQAVDIIASPHCSLSPEEKQTLIQSKIDLLPIHKGDLKGLRIDVSIENTETGETKWIDTTAVHTSCVTYQAQELKAITKRNLSAAVAENQSLPDALLQDPSPTVLDREKLKTEKYSRLVLMASKQFVDGKRSSRPTFAPFVVSDLGELGPNAIELQEWIVEQYRRKLVKTGRRNDGCSTSELVRNFRHKFKVGIQLAMASGLGAMIQAAGQPWGDIGA
jgi:hypothetical protein